MSAPISLLVAGAGTMGAGIARVAAAAGETVFLYDRVPEAPGQAVERISHSLRRDLERGRITEAAYRTTLEHLHPVTALDAVEPVTLVVEAIREDLETKRAFYQENAPLANSRCFIWSNTSMLSISALAEGVPNPGRFCGVHFFNPVPRMRLVELIAGKATAPETLAFAAERVARWGKRPVHAPDAPGFIVNRVLDGIKREALALVELGVPPEEIDTAVKLGLNFPMGPLELMDLIGLDTTLDVLVNQAAAMGRPLTGPTPLHRLVDAGKLGRKSGEGFYTYPERPPAPR